MAVAQPVVHRPEADAYVRTRRQLHGVAEILIAGPQHRRHSTTRMSVTPTGFCGAVLRIVDGTDLVWPQRRAKLAGPLAALAAAAGVGIGASVELYHRSNPLSVVTVLDLDAQAAARVHHSLRIGAPALKAFAADHQPVMWPEHFDVAVTVDGAICGVSTGDVYHQRSYGYVGAPTMASCPLWNAPFGALRSLEPGDDVADILDFLLQGKEHLT